MDGLDAVIAARLRELMRADGSRHEDLAAAMRTLGFPWRANQVAQVVTGRRSLSLLEVAGVCEVLHRPLTDLLQAEATGTPGDKVVLPRLQHDALLVPLDHIRRALTGSAGPWMAHGQAHATDSEAVHEATIKAARRLGLTPTEVSVASAQLWGRPLAWERDSRLGDGDQDPRRLQARRGHATRALLGELRAHVEQQRQRQRWHFGFEQPVVSRSEEGQP